ncbi:TRAF3-interacting protein 1 [Armadillidium nasatum]|uniref:TRAF3-interacting protein 1 n=1 Tax=Armadillidium nasatum TaxID=96803 RepID=A0A5N5TLR3_9CRUS|nr:TRAF3-interacting protein 1 [Armadillidium nasatum]
MVIKLLSLDMEGLDPEQEPNEETFEGETETLIPQEGLSNDGPSSLPITDGGSNQDTSLHGSEINSQPQNDENNENNIEDSTTRPNSGNVDVASVKEMSPNVDSGVGSLESPKVSGKGESLPNTAEMKARSPPVPIPPTPGPRPPPLKAYHPDLQEEEEGTSSPIGNQMENKIDEPPERPKTGMSIRPRTGRKSARPPSARPPPPKARERREIPEELPRPPTGKPVPNVILDSDQNNENLDDDDDNFTVGTSRPILDEENEHNVEHSKDPSLEKDKQELLEGDQDAKGILVAQILETKKELEDNRREAFSPETPGHRRVPLEQAFGGDVGRKKEKELIQKDVEKLTSSIQALTRSVNPLAKMLDYLQEDFDSMQKELENWRKENKTLSQNLNAEQSLTDQQLEPLKTQLQEMESAIYDQHDRISAIKAIILRNDEKISRLLGGINVKA